MSDPQTLSSTDRYARAYLLIEGGERLDCWFNPQTLDRSRKASWTYRTAYGQGAPRATYRGGREENLTLKLLLHADDPTKDGPRVRNTIDKFFKLLDPATKTPGRNRSQKRPRTVQFVWGKYVSFVAATESVSVNIELFDSDGTPLRAQVTLQLRQYSPTPGQATAPGQNPTTRTTSRAKSHLVLRGDSLHSIAFAHLGDPARWREIAELNEIDDPLALEVGSRLVVPVPEAG